MARKKSAKAKSKQGTYAIIGMLVTKLAIPFMVKQGKKRTKRAAANAASSGVGAVKRHPARTGIAVGAIIGAAGYVASRIIRSDEPLEPGDE